MTEHEFLDAVTKDQAARTMLAALKEIATHWANNYDHPHANTEMYRGPYGVGVVDGHRACAIIARAAIAQAEAAGIKAEG